MARYSWEAEQRRALRAEQRRLRELQRQAKEQAKLSAQDQARIEVAEHEARIDVLLSVHRECGSDWKWIELASILLPPEPTRRKFEEFAERLNVLTLQISPDRAEKTLVDATTEDMRSTAEARARYQNGVIEGRHYAELGLGILAGDTRSYHRAIATEEPFKELVELGCRVSWEIPCSSLIECQITIPGTDVIPAEAKSLTASCKVSAKAMPKGRFHEIYEDLLCGSALRAARELFALLPIEIVLVHAIADCENPQTGDSSRECVLSAAFDRSRLCAIDFSSVDASETVAQFPNNCDFRATRKSGAFKPVVRLSPERFPAAGICSEGPSPDDLLTAVRRLNTEILELCGELAPPLPKVEALSTPPLSS